MQVISGLINLKELDLSDNKLTDLPPSFFNLVALEVTISQNFHRIFTEFSRDRKANDYLPQN